MSEYNSYNENYDVAFETSDVFAIDIVKKIEANILYPGDSKLTDWLYSLTGFELAMVLRYVGLASHSSFMADDDYRDIVMMIGFIIRMESGDDKIIIDGTKLNEYVYTVFVAAHLENFRRKKWLVYKPFGILDGLKGVKYELHELGVKGFKYSGSESKFDWALQDEEFDKLSPKMKDFFGEFE